jgi:mono/diheme cytochrome c family protein
MFKTKYIVLIAIIGTVLFGCTKAVIIEEITEPVTETVTYDDHVQSIIFNNCTTCHAGAAPSAGIDLTTYQNVRFQAESGNLVPRMNNASNPMPPSGTLSPDQLAIIDKWVEDGFLEN